jgi:hypothetical protein
MINVNDYVRLNDNDTIEAAIAAKEAAAPGYNKASERWFKFLMLYKVSRNMSFNMVHTN